MAAQIERVDGRVEVGALPVLQASRPGLFRVFQNLIANAFKFRDGDAPHVTMSARHGDAGWAFSVRDKRSSETTVKGRSQIAQSDSAPSPSVIALARRPLDQRRSSGVKPGG